MTNFNKNLLQVTEGERVRNAGLVAGAASQGHAGAVVRPVGRL